MLSSNASGFLPLEEENLAVEAQGARECGSKLFMLDLESVVIFNGEFNIADESERQGKQ